MAAKYTYKDWKAGDTWPTDVPRRVRNAQTNHIIFYNEQRIRPGVTFTLNKPSDFSETTMANAAEPKPTPAAASAGDKIGPAQSGRKLSSADLTKRRTAPPLHPEDEAPVERAPDKPKGDHVL